jgi:hypothetical protein
LSVSPCRSQGETIRPPFQRHRLCRSSLFRSFRVSRTIQCEAPNSCCMGLARTRRHATASKAVVQLVGSVWRHADRPDFPVHRSTNRDRQGGLCSYSGRNAGQGGRRNRPRSLGAARTTNSAFSEKKASRTRSSGAGFFRSPCATLRLRARRPRPWMSHSNVVGQVLGSHALPDR